ncbi:MAG: SAM-dependent methyltransferase [Acidimicrobiia bacterium]|nr:SAM-dependent methyltransferase [Acidimicrobiia bacterium]
MQDNYTLRPIGVVRTSGDGFTLAIEEPFRAALTELSGFSHVNVLWWADQLDEPLFREMTIAERPYKKAPAAVGIFATRSPARPNPIGLTVAQITSIDGHGGLVHITYIDADEGTPVLDLKPYLPATDRVRNARYPEWALDWPEWYEDSATFDWGAVFENAQ